MSTTLIDRLFAAGEAITGKAYRMIAARRFRDGVASPLRTDNYGSLNVAFSDKTGTKDIFQRLRISEPFTLFDGKQILDSAPLIYNTELVSGGTTTYLPNEASSRLEVTGTSGSRTTRQSRLYVPYQPGKSQYIIMTGVFGAAVSNVRRRMGYFDDENGIYLEQISAGVAVVLRSFTSGSVVNTSVVQANWNIDPLDGTGPSGLTLDLTKFLIVFIEFGWLGGAGVRIGIYLDGEATYVHSFDLSANSTVFMTTPVLPLRWEIASTAASAGGSLIQTCGAAYSEGGFSPTGYVGSRGTLVSRGVTTSPLPVVSVRLKTAYARGLLLPLGASAQVTSIDDVICQVVVGGTLTGANWNDTDLDATEFDVEATAITGGTTIATFFANNNSGDISKSFDSALVVAAAFAGATDNISLVIQTDVGTAGVLGALDWKEIY